MKICYLLFTIGLIIAPFRSNAQIMGCDFFMPGPAADLLNSFFKNDCKNTQSEARFCECLMDELKGNELKESLMDKQSPEEWRHKNKDKNRDNLLNIYSNLNYEMSFQERSFGPKKNNDKRLGCTPEDIAKEFTASLCNEYEDCGLTKGGAAIGNTKAPSLAECPNGDCSKIYNEINARFSDKIKPYVIPKAKQGSVEEGALSEFSKNEKAKFTFNIGAVTSATKSALSSCDVDIDGTTKDPNVIDKMNAHLEKARAFFTKHPQLLVTTTQENLSVISADCSNTAKLSVAIISEYEAKKIFDPSLANDIPFSQDLVASNLRSKDAEIQEKFKDGLKRSLPNACIDYNKYKVISGAPSEKLVQEWGSIKNKDDMLKMLDPKNGNQSSETINFLRKNPMIAKNIASDSQRKILADKLFNFSEKVKNQGEKERLKSYLNFMNNDITKMNSDKNVDILQCRLLAQNFAALENLDEIPSLGLEKGSPIESLGTQYMACKMREENQDRSNSLSHHELVAANNLFSLYDDTNYQTDPAKDEGYAKYLETNCKGYDDYVKKHIGFACLLNFDKENCKKKLLDSENPKRARFLKRYYAKHPELKEIISLIDDNTNELDLNDVTDVTNQDKQDKVAKSHFDETVTPHLRKRSIFSTDDIFSSSSNNSPVNQEIISAMNEAQESYPAASNSDSVAQIKNTSSTPNKMSTLSETSTGALGQVTPSYLNPPASHEVPKQLSNVDDVTKALDNIERYSDDQKEDILDQTKEFLAYNEINKLKKEELEKKIAQYDNEADEILKNKEQKIPATENVRKPSSIPARTQSNLVAPRSGPSNVSSAQSATHATLSPSKIESKAVASYSKALIQMNEKSSPIGEKALITQESSIQFSNKPISASEIGGNLVVDVPLEPDVASFAKLIASESEMKAYLVRNLKEVSSNKIVSITCKGMSCDPKAKEILLYVSKDANNRFIFRSVIMDTDVPRVHRAIDMTRAIDQEVKSKQ